MKNKLITEIKVGRKFTKKFYFYQKYAKFLRKCECSKTLLKCRGRRVMKTRNPFGLRKGLNRLVRDAIIRQTDLI